MWLLVLDNQCLTKSHMPKWQMARPSCQNGRRAITCCIASTYDESKKIFTKGVDSADTKGILIASHDKKPNDHDAKKSSDWHLTSDVLDGKICLLGLDNTTNLESLL